MTPELTLQYDRPVTFKVIGCVLFGHRWTTATGTAVPTTVQTVQFPGPGPVMSETTVGVSAPADGGTDTVVTCRWCGKREVLPPGTSIVEWRSYYRSYRRGSRSYDP
jgi:hypothetical protein